MTDQALIKPTTGLMLINKPRGISSNKVVSIAKRCLGAKVGHLGTLDAAAEGLLVLSVGSSTKLFNLFLEKDKTYQSKFKFGEFSPTFDLDGELTKTSDKKIDISDIKKALPKFIGEIDQLPPDFSAKKINGKTAYALAREGKSFTLAPKRVSVFSFEVICEISFNLFQFEICCSSGTYIRALCRDLAAELSTSGVCYDIIRTRCGDFELKNAISLEELKAGKAKLISPDHFFDYEKIDLTTFEEQRLLNGATLEKEISEGQYKLYCQDFIGIGEVKQGELKLKLRLN